MSKSEELIKYLKFCKQVMKERKANKDRKYSCLEDFVLTHGREMDYAPDSVMKGYDMSLCSTPKQCYQNASLMVLEHNKDLIYCEGYAAGVFPVLHAWCMIKSSGEVIDPTWSVFRSHKEDVYFGVPFKTEFLREHLVNNEVYGILDDLRNDFPALRKGFDKNIWRRK